MGEELRSRPGQRPTVERLWGMPLEMHRNKHFAYTTAIAGQSPMSRVMSLRSVRATDSLFTRSRPIHTIHTIIAERVNHRIPTMLEYKR